MKAKLLRVLRLLSLDVLLLGLFEKLYNRLNKKAAALENIAKRFRQAVENYDK